MKMERPALNPFVLQEQLIRITLPLPDYPSPGLEFDPSAIRAPQEDECCWTTWMTPPW